MMRSSVIGGIATTTSAQLRNGHTFSLGYILHELARLFVADGQVRHL
jgi:hypothetical protein